MIKLKAHKKKMIVPIMVSVIVILYYMVYFGFLITRLDGLWKYILGVIPFALSIIMVKVCRERIDEIKGGEEDDLSKY